MADSSSPALPTTLEAVRSAGDHFAVFGLPRRYVVDPADLEQRYMALARLTHPDLAGTEPEQQLEAIELSSRVNEAHRTLADEEERANYLLELLGGPRRDEDKSLPGGFLPIIMMIREELAEAQLEGDAERVAGIEADAKAQRLARVREIASLFAAGPTAAGPTADALKQIRTELNALRYYQRLLEQVNPDSQPRM